LDNAILVGTFCPHHVGFTRTHTHTHTLMPHLHKSMPGRSTGCLDSTKWRGSQLPESCQSLFRGQDVSKCVFF